jgi:hypothetical protein
MSRVGYTASQTSARLPRRFAAPSGPVLPSDHRIGKEVDRASSTAIRGGFTDKHRPVSFARGKLGSTSPLFQIGTKFGCGDCRLISSRRMEIVEAITESMLVATTKTNHRRSRRMRRAPASPRRLRADILTTGTITVGAVSNASSEMRPALRDRHPNRAHRRLAGAPAVRGQRCYSRVESGPT